MLLADVIGRFGEVTYEVECLGNIIVAFVSVEDHSCAQGDVVMIIGNDVEDRDEVALEKVDFIDHGAGRIDDEGDVGSSFGRRGYNCIVVGHDLSVCIPVGDIGITLHQFSPDLYGESFFFDGSLTGCRDGNVDPEGGISLVVGPGLPDRLAVAQQFYLGVDGVSPVGCRNMDSDSVAGVEAPEVGEFAEPFAVFAGLGRHELAPEIPVGEVVPFGGGEDAGTCLGSTIACAPAPVIIFCVSVSCIEMMAIFAARDCGCGNSK